MFERFTSRARNVIVSAQEEARALQHNYIGTEHLLLGLLRESEGLVARALHDRGVSLETTRQQIESVTGRGKKVPKGHIPFTPRAKKVLELGLREALRLGHNYIGTEHLLLGLIREGDGLGARLLKDQAGDLDRVRTAVLDLLPSAGAPRGRSWRRRLRLRPALEEAPGPEELCTTDAADASLEEARRLAGDEPVGSHHLLLAALGDQDSAAAKALGSLGVDLEQAREALRRVDVIGTSDEQPEQTGRRQMWLRLTDEGLALETTDPTLVAQAKAALAAYGDSGNGLIPGDLPMSASLADVWQALHASLDDIRRRAAATTEAKPA
jgi:ATP-dependent Clp protease ATP-binding subunit ClpA